jgi:predicted NAD-dependent protein-ADP-ribosyltransferase YbiA (DUF1768 family)
MEIRSGNGYPSSALSNFAPHPFVIDGVECNSMEGFLQSLKFKEVEMQKYVCTLVGAQAKYKGKPKKWWQTQTLWWQGVEIDRHSEDYQNLLDRAYEELSKNDGFRRALLSTRDSTITHSMGKNDESKTVLTEREFCGRLMKIREKLKEEVK